MKIVKKFLTTFFWTTLGMPLALVVAAGGLFLDWGRGESSSTGFAFGLVAMLGVGGFVVVLFSVAVAAVFQLAGAGWPPSLRSQEPCACCARWGWRPSAGWRASPSPPTTTPTASARPPGMCVRPTPSSWWTGC